MQKIYFILVSRVSISFPTNGNIKTIWKEGSHDQILARRCLLKALSPSLAL